MPIKTKKVQGRRTVRYESFDELLADVRRLAGSEVRTLGNWSQGQIYEHIARALDSSIDGMGFSLPAPVRWMMTLLMKRRFLKKSIPAGFKTTSQFTPEETSVEAQHGSDTYTPGLQSSRQRGTTRLGTFTSTSCSPGRTGRRRKYLKRGSMRLKESPTSCISRQLIRAPDGSWVSTL